MKQPLPDKINNLYDYPFLKKINGRDVVFIHIPKSGGTSISRALDLNRPSLTKSHKHHSVQDIYPHFDPVAWENSFKFCFFRNPWDRLFSHYRFKKRRGHRDPRFEDTSFNEYVKIRFSVDVPNTSNRRSQCNWIKNKNGEIVMDFIGQFEKMESDFKRLCTILDINTILPQKNVSLPRLDYRTQYDQASIEIVEKFYAEDIAYFNYTFE